MSPSVREKKLAKYQALLNLAVAQLQAIDALDQERLGLIMEQKCAIIRSLSGTKELLELEPGLAETIKKIQDADRFAERKLSFRMNQTRTRLLQINKQQAARQAYTSVARKKHPIMGLAIDDTTPRYFDIQT